MSSLPGVVIPNMSVLIPLHCVSSTHQPHNIPWDKFSAPPYALLPTLSPPTQRTTISPTNASYSDSESKLNLWHGHNDDIGAPCLKTWQCLQFLATQWQRNNWCRQYHSVVKTNIGIKLAVIPFPSTLIRILNVAPHLAPSCSIICNAIERLILKHTPYWLKF